jgi:hypothetical protein
MSFTNPWKKKSRGIKYGEWGGGARNGSLSSYLIIRKIYIQKSKNMTWEVKFSSQMAHHLTSPVMFMPFWTGHFLIIIQEGEDPSLASSFSRFDSSGCFFSEGL